MGRQPRTRAEHQLLLCRTLCPYHAGFQQASGSRYHRPLVKSAHCWTFVPTVVWPFTCWTTRLANPHKRQSWKKHLTSLHHAFTWRSQCI
ncbi:hypothetical protein M011DRAFT_157152 [Sporormia fimetaria CBS 119925]|uniref:Uncharacterized protein n=1 Tax=Sporormia fimetaria CBS 119925 TaxID=1340428 RepID=A0A6A6V2K8_9PLEO|nr:hypothetical protein M011DRAFT_157152 [Sporormia fimetaria CBS 119925]